MSSPSPGRIACLVVSTSGDRLAWEQVLEILGAHSPLVEEALGEEGEAVAYLDASGVAPRYGSEEAWCRAILEEIGGGPHPPAPSPTGYVGEGGRKKSGPHPPPRASRESGPPTPPCASRESGPPTPPCASRESGPPTPPCASRKSGPPTLSPPLPCISWERGPGGEGRLGLASSKFAAWVAAHTAPADPGCRVVAEPDRQFLAPLPAAWLPLSAETQRRLLMLGIRTIGRFARLPPSAVAEQFAPDSLEAHRWARGLDDRPVIGRRCQVARAQGAFEAPEGRREALVQMALRLSRRALADLPTSPRAWAVKRVELQAAFAEGGSAQRSLWAPMPCAGDAPGQQTLRVLLEEMVDSLQDVGRASQPAQEQGVMELEIKLLGLEPAQGWQMDLFASIETRRRLEQTLQQLAKKHASCVALVVALDVDAPILEERYAFRVQAAPLWAGQDE